MEETQRLAILVEKKQTSVDVQVARMSSWQAAHTSTPSSVSLSDPHGGYACDALQAVDAHYTHHYTHAPIRCTKKQSVA